MSTATAQVDSKATTAGTFSTIGRAELQKVGSAVARHMTIPVTNFVDPSGYYMRLSTVSGAGSGTALLSWFETDLLSILVSSKDQCLPVRDPSASDHET
jgi:hypothetical protein